jgi:RNA recognition motif-containing protein
MNMHVTNLSLSIIDSDLSTLFAAYGVVSFVVIVRDIKNGRSRGIAFVEMPVQAQAQQAILGLHKMEIDGQKISVREIEYNPGEFNN